MVQYENSVMYEICCRDPTISHDRIGSTNEFRNESLITNRIATIKMLSFIVNMITSLFVKTVDGMLGRL